MYDSCRLKKSPGNGRNLFHPVKQKSRVVEKHRRGRASAYGAKDKGQAVALFSQRFLRSLNRAIRKVENKEVVPFTNASKHELRTLDRVIDNIRLDGFDRVDIDLNHFDTDFPKKIMEFTGLKNLVYEDEELTLGSIPNEEEYGYFDYYLEAIDDWFACCYGVITVAVMVFLHKNGQWPGYAANSTEIYQEWAEGNADYLDPTEKDPKRQAEIKEDIFHYKQMSRQIKESEIRLEDFLAYMETEVRMAPICKILNRYAKKYKSEALKTISDALANLASFTEMFDTKVMPWMMGTDMFNMIVWFGNREQHAEFIDQFNENYGSTEGTKLTYPKVSPSEEPLDEAMLYIWKRLSENPPPYNVIQQYSEILKDLTNEDLIAEFARVSAESNLVATLYRELDRMPGRSARKRKRWESVGVSSSLTQLLKKTRRLTFGERERKPGQDVKNINS